jgi:transcriptional regulator with XRE-family HTH domain
MNYGKGIKIARTISGLSQKQLSKRADIDASHISLIEKGKRKPTLRTLERLIRALNIPHDLLILLSADQNELAISDPKELERVAQSLVRLLVRDGSKTKRRRRTPSQGWLLVT